MGSLDQPVAEIVNGHEGGVDGADVNAAHGDNAPIGDSAGTFHGDAIVASALIEVAEPLFDAHPTTVDAACGRTQRPDLDVLGRERLQLIQATLIESVDGASDDV